MTNLKISENAGANTSGGLFVPGDIIIWQSSSIPNGWLACDGNTFSSTLYPDLANAIGTRYGGGTAYRTPNLNANSTTGSLLGTNTNPIYPQGTVSNSSTAVTYSFTEHYHGHTGNQSLTSNSFTNANHHHTGTVTSGNGTDSHSHNSFTIANAGGTAYSGQADGPVNYSSNGSSGSHSYANHLHNHNGTNLGFSAVSNVHTHTTDISYNADDGAGSHTHTTTIGPVGSSTSASMLPLSLSVRYIIKV